MDLDILKWVHISLKLERVKREFSCCCVGCSGSQICYLRLILSIIRNAVLFYFISIKYFQTLENPVLSLCVSFSICSAGRYRRYNLGAIVYKVSHRCIRQFTTLCKLICNTNQGELYFLQSSPHFDCPLNN